MENVVLAGWIGGPQIILIIVAILLLFGGRKIPELMRGMGKGIKGFKDEMNGTADSDNTPAKGDNSEDSKSEA
ncbi:twin-arginine translocase TatA/TatE family subunit [Paracrocinitomix mangrovi]|uniref:Sec-independent protein translocase subunit TatA/TatB n=1 Tax=Paracrocinitomix mangrovi TaxID=2862509 RepID=UPI001C8E3C08|nr:twin-arginine translocase TatA/TatE family subunit [Paracrocinitomix mangrovi]UKN00941.1 twin-arginine translocase TatA/TatE family subunit [Paracrocinitomix mangrovi]